MNLEQALNSVTDVHIRIGKDIETLDYRVLASRSVRKQTFIVLVSLQFVVRCCDSPKKGRQEG